MNNNVKDYIELVSGEQILMTVSKNSKLIIYSVASGNLRVEYDAVFKKYKFFISKDIVKGCYNTFTNYKIKKIIKKIPTCRIKRKELK